MQGDFENVRLKRSDVSTIVGILHEESGQRPVDILTESCRFDDLADFLKTEEPFRRLEIEAPSLTIIVLVEAWSVTVSLGRADTLGRGVLDRLRVILEARNVWITPMRLVLLAAFGLALVAMRLRSRGASLIPTMPDVGWVVVLGGLAICVGWAVGRINRGLRHSEVRFAAEKNQPVDVRAAAWEVFKLLLAAGLGALVTLALRR